MFFHPAFDFEAVRFFQNEVPMTGEWSWNDANPMCPNQTPCCCQRVVATKGDKRFVDCPRHKRMKVMKSFVYCNLRWVS